MEAVLGTVYVMVLEDRVFAGSSFAGLLVQQTTPFESQTVCTSGAKRVMWAEVMMLKDQLQSEGAQNASERFVTPFTMVVIGYTGWLSWWPLGVMPRRFGSVNSSRTTTAILNVDASSATRYAPVRGTDKVSNDKEAGLRAVVIGNRTICTI